MNVVGRKNDAYSKLCYTVAMERDADLRQYMNWLQRAKGRGIKRAAEVARFLTPGLWRLPQGVSLSHVLLAHKMLR